MSTEIRPPVIQTHLGLFHTTERPLGPRREEGAEAVQRQEARVHLQQLRQKQREGREEDQAQGAVA